jgi:hypothetical protein
MRERDISKKSSPVWLFEISANDIHQLVRRFSRVFPVVGFEHVVSQMPFDQFMPPRAAAINCSTSAQSVSLSKARSTASICPRIRFMRTISLCLFFEV